MISTSGSGQMLPLPMNEALQENLKQACDVDVKVEAGRMAGAAERRPRRARRARR